MSNSNGVKTTLSKNPHAEAVITGTILAADIEKEFAKTLDRVVSEVELPGFRKGKAPKERVLEEVGEKSIWRQAAEEVLRDQLGDIIKEHKVIPILPPSFSLSVTAHNTDVPFTVTLITQPTCEIKDVKDVAEKALGKLEKLDGAKEKTEARKSLNAQAAAMTGKTNPDEPLTDEDAKKVGFENAKALELFLDSEAERAVENYDNQRKRGAVAEAMLAAATYDIPEVMIDDEVRGMLESAKQDIARQGMPWNEYLKRSGKTEEQILNEFKPQAEKRTALDMIFAKIAHEQKITPDDAEVHRVAHALEHQGAPSDRAHQYAAEVSIREKIWTFLGIAAPAKPLEPEHTHDHSHDHDHHDHDHDGHTH